MYFSSNASHAPALQNKAHFVKGRTVQDYKWDTLKSIIGSNNLNKERMLHCALFEQIAGKEPFPHAANTRFFFVLCQ